jgi:hypothetical protein
MKAITKKVETVTLEMTQLEAAYLHAFLGQFSSNEFIRNVKNAVSDDCHFLPEKFDPEKFDPQFRKLTDGYYFTLDKALQELRDAELKNGN